MLKAQVQAITTVTPEGAGPPENNIYSSYMSGMTRLVLVQEHPDSTEDAIIPWPTYAARAARGAGAKSFTSTFGNND